MQIGDSGDIGVIANAGSGRNSREAAAIDRAMAVFGSRARLVWWDAEGDIADHVEDLAAEGRRTIVAAGGDGTVTALASALAGTDLRLAVLPLGTFNFFARGVGLPDDPEGAARAILAGRTRHIAIGTVNGQVFLNNASLGLYPAILREREAIYGRWGRYRLLAHWSVVKTFLRFRRPMRITLRVGEEERAMVTPLVFVARSAYQLERYGLSGAAAISDDRFALFVAIGGHRGRDLFRLTWRLVRQQVEIGRDVELIEADRIGIDVAGPAPLVAFDGEKARMTSPVEFRILPDALSIVLPEDGPAGTKGDAPRGPETGRGEAEGPEAERKAGDGDEAGRRDTGQGEDAGDVRAGMDTPRGQDSRAAGGAPVRIPQAGREPPTPERIETEVRPPAQAGETLGGGLPGTGGLLQGSSSSAPLPLGQASPERQTEGQEPLPDAAMGRRSDDAHDPRDGDPAASGSARPLRSGIPDASASTGHPGDGDPTPWVSANPGRTNDPVPGVLMREASEGAAGHPHEGGSVAASSSGGDPGGADHLQPDSSVVSRPSGPSSSHGADETSPARNGHAAAAVPATASSGAAGPGRA